MSAREICCTPVDPVVDLDRDTSNQRGYVPHSLQIVEFQVEVGNPKS